MIARRVVVMGVAGSGKTTVGLRLASLLDARFVDADDVHPPTNVEKMASGVPLTDADRAPWLRRLRDELAGDGSTVVTCSALKRRYRDVLRAAGEVTFVFLDIDRDAVIERVAGRDGHFMKADMVDSQFADLEPPQADEHDIVAVDAERSITEVVDAAFDAVTGAR
jgi:gluconokinase